MRIIIALLFVVLSVLGSSATAAEFTLSTDIRTKYHVPLGKVLGADPVLHGNFTVAHRSFFISVDTWSPLSGAEEFAGEIDLTVGWHHKITPTWHLTVWGCYFDYKEFLQMDDDLAGGGVLITRKWDRETVTHALGLYAEYVPLLSDTTKGAWNHRLRYTLSHTAGSVSWTFQQDFIHDATPGSPGDLFLSHTQWTTAVRIADRASVSLTARHTHGIDAPERTHTSAWIGIRTAW
jgi:hypothetical protein